MSSTTVTTTPSNSSSAPRENKERMVGINISFPLSMLDQIDKFAAESGMDRSKYVRKCIKLAWIANRGQAIAAAMTMTSNNGDDNNNNNSNSSNSNNNSGNNAKVS